MNRFMPMLKLEEIKDDQGGAIPPAAESKKEPDTAANTQKDEAEGDNTDEFGYPKAAAAQAPDDKKAPDEKKDPAEEPEKVEAASGYGDEPKVEEDQKAPEKKDEKKDPPAEKDELDKAIGEGLSENDLKEIKKIAVEEGLTPKQAKRIADVRRQEFKEASEFAQNQEKEAKNAQIRQRAEWYKELKEDKDFGGESFDKNRMLVDKVLGELMPSTKKRLTESKGMLPPYLMRDLAKLGKSWYANDKMVHGTPTTPKDDKKEGNFLDDLYV